MWQTIGSVMSYYNFYDDGQSMPFGFNEVYAPVMWWMGSNMQPLFASNGWGLDRVTRAWCPAILDMQPSARIRTDTLNSSANLAREAGALRARVSIVADKSPINGLFSMLWANDAPTRNGWINARWGFYAGAIASYWGYSRSSDPLLRQRANDFLSLAALMIDLDFWYAKLTGSLIAYQMTPATRSWPREISLCRWEVNAFPPSRRSTFFRVTLICNKRGRHKQWPPCSQPWVRTLACRYALSVQSRRSTFSRLL
jgi:hypothetical protein